MTRVRMAALKLGRVQNQRLAANDELAIPAC
jgi:hypothetical protein